MRTDGTVNLIPLPGDISRDPRRFTKNLEFSWLTLYVVALGAAAAALTATVAMAGFALEAPWAVVCLAAIAAWAERGSVRVTSTTEVSISLVPTLLAAVLFGPLAAVAVAAVSMLPDLFESDAPQPYLRWATYTATRVITAACAGLAAVGAAAGVDGRIASTAMATAGGAIVAALLDTAFSAVTTRVRRKGARSVIAALVPLYLISIPLYAPVVAVVAVAYNDISPLTLPLFLIPALAAHRLHGMYRTQLTLTSRLLNANGALERANMSFAAALVATLDARDQYTAGHSTVVATYANDIAVRLGLPPEEQQLAKLTGLVHDIGKIGLPAGLLEKNGPLTLAERRIMEQHSEIGERILLNVEDYAQVAKYVRHHHERIDGTGYPDRLGGENIPLISRIIAVADAYNAMTSNRPYRLAMPTHVARLRLAQGVGSQFDTAVVAAFEAVLTSETDEYRAGVPADRAGAARPRELRVATA